MNAKQKPTLDPETGMRAMKTVKITVTDEDGTLLDRQEIEVTADCATIAFRPIEGTLAERGDEQTLIIGRSN